MKTIWKYQLNRVAQAKIDIPIGAQILSAQMQDGIIAVWALVDPAAPKQPKAFHIFGTGWDIEETSLCYVATVQDKDGFVWHIFTN